MTNATHLQLNTITGDDQGKVRDLRHALPLLYHTPHASAGISKRHCSYSPLEGSVEHEVLYMSPLAICND